MSTKKISDLNLLTQVNLDSASDELAIVDDGAGETKKITPVSYTHLTLPTTSRV